LALGYIRREVSVPDREVMIGGAKAIVAALPFADSALLQEEQSFEQRPA